MPPEHLISFTVDRDLHQPDMAAVVLTNTDHSYSKTKMGSSVEIKVGKDAKSIYKGEVVGLEPAYTGGEKTRITLRVMNKFHRLLRKRKSMTYADKTDQQILQQVASDSGLTLEFDGPSITYKHVYQHNQTDMEFMRTRAARIGCHLWCVDTTLYCKKPNLGNDSGVKLDAKQAVSEGPQLRSFTPRLSSAPTLSKVTVKGWNPETKELITGTASAQSSPLGDNNASSSASDFGDNEGFTVDHPIWSAEEANALAAAHLQDTALKYMTGEVEAVGDPVFELATVITVTVNTEASDAFNGKYYVAGISYRHIAGGKGKDGGFVSLLRLQRDAQEGSHT